MPFYRPTREQIRRRVQSDFRYAFDNDAVMVQGTIEHAFCEALVGLSHAQHGRLDQIYRDAFPHLASEPALIKWAAFFGMFRNRATYATGPIGIYGNDGAVLPVGTIIARVDGSEYRTLTGATWDDDSVKTFQVKARVPGLAGNALSGEQMAVQETIVGIQPLVEVAPPGITGGADAETPAALRTRLLALLDQPEAGGGPGDYVRWAKNVTGVTRAWEFGKVPKIGNVTVLFMRDNDPTPFPGVDDRAAVLDELKLHAPIALPDPIVVSPTPKDLALEIKLLVEDGADVDEVKAAIIQSIQDMIAVRAEPVAGASKFYRSWISEAISVTTGEKDHVLVEPADNIDLAQWELVTLDPNDVTWSAYP